MTSSIARIANGFLGTSPPTSKVFSPRPARGKILSLFYGAFRPLFRLDRERPTGIPSGHLPILGCVNESEKSASSVVPQFEFCRIFRTR